MRLRRIGIIALLAVIMLAALTVMPAFAGDNTAITQAPAVSATAPAVTAAPAPTPVDPWTKIYILASAVVTVASVLKALNLCPSWAAKAIDTASNFDPTKIMIIRQALYNADARTQTAKSIIQQVNDQQKWGLTPETVDNLIDVVSVYAKQLRIKLR